MEEKDKRKVSFDAKTVDNEEIDQIISDGNNHNMKEEKTRNKIVLVEQIYSEPVDDFDLAFKDDLVKMKEMGLPLGFLNVTPYEVDDNGVVEAALKGGMRTGKVKRRR